MALLKVFYRWAAYEPHEKNSSTASIVVIRAKANTVSKDRAQSVKSSGDKTHEEFKNDSVLSSPLSGKVDQEGTPDTEIDILNSFYAKDIDRAINALESGERPAALISYLSPSSESERIDLYKPAGRQFVVDALAPRFLNHGHWLDDPDNVMSLMQQVAIGQIFQRLQHSGLISVNGPPGTGKTTLLREIFGSSGFSYGELR